MEPPIAFAHISDTHISTGKKFRADAFERLIQKVNSLDVNMILHSGDVTEEGLRGEYKLARQLMSRFNKPIVVVPGNHDSRNVGYELFEHYIGQREGFISSDQYLLLWLDSSVPDKNEGRFGRDTIRKTREILSDFGESKVKILMFHHHILPVPKTGRERHITTDAGAMIETILDFGVDLVLTGHRHYPNNYKLEDSIIVNAGTSSSYKTRAGGPRTFNLIRIWPREQIEVKTISLDGDTTEPALSHETYSIARKTRLLPASKVRLRIAQISNTHFSSGSLFNEAAAKTAFKLLARLNPDLILHCGNITASGGIEEFGIARSYLEPYLDRMVVVAGPRDLKSLGEQYYWDIFGGNPVVDKEEVIIHRIESSQPEEWDGHVGRRPLRKFEELSRKAFRTKPESIQIALLHHHLIPIPKVKENYIVEDAGDVLRALVDSPVKLVLTGFKHIGFMTRLNGTIFINANSLSSTIVRSQITNSFNLIDFLENGGIVATEINVISGSRRVLGIYPELPEKKVGTYVSPKLTIETESKSYLKSGV